MTYEYINAIILLSIIAIVYCLLVYIEEKKIEQMDKK